MKGKYYMSREINCPFCKQNVEITKIRTGERLSYKYMNFVKAVGICPNCLSEVHIPEIDDMIERLQNINKEYSNMLKEYDDGTSSTISKDFSEDWYTISSETLQFESPGAEYTLSNIVYHGTLKSEFDYDVVTIDNIYLDVIDDIEDEILKVDDDVSEEEDEDEYDYSYFKTYVHVNGKMREVCCMMWRNVEDSVSGIIFNKDDTTSFRYGKQKTKDKYVIV
jgi:hypothetical protein